MSAIKTAQFSETQALGVINPSPSRPWLGWIAAASAWIDRFVPENFREAPEQMRRARMILRFGFLGLIFGLAYAAFYAAIQHFWGASIILICSLGFGLVPFILRETHRLSLAGNLLAAIMTFGFTTLCAVEGGLGGHAVAWLASVPLCALLVAGKDSARGWGIICFAVCSAAVAAELMEIKVPITYDLAWHPLVNSAGYLGLIAFMYALGLIFETSRARAFRRMNVTLTQLAQSNEQLVLLNKEKTEFLGIASHDLKNPLTTIISYAQILERSHKPEEVARFSRSIYSAGARMRDLIAKLLDANAVEEGRFSCKIERCDVRALVAQSLEHNRLEADRKRIALLPLPGEKEWAQADPSTAVQILDNLISNAIKYSPFETSVRIRVAAENGEIVVAVQDEGPGLSEEDQARLFQKFTRLSPQPTGGESSTGLGLSIVKRLAEAMSGSVECQSALGQGATFILRLPRWDS